METLREALTKEYLKRLEEMAIRLKHRLSTDGYSGARRSMAKGSSLEFSDYREYAAGDDLRRAIRCICLPLGILSGHRSGIWHKRDVSWKPWIFWTNWKQSGGLRLCPQPWDAVLCGVALPL